MISPDKRKVATPTPTSSARNTSARQQTLSAASTPYQSLLGTHRASESKKTKKWDHFASQLIALCRAEARLPAAWGKGGQRSGIGKANTAGRGAVGVPQLGGARFALFFSRQFYIYRQFAIQQNVADPFARNEAAGWWTGWRQSIHGSDHLACALRVAVDTVGSELESVGFATRFVLCRLFRFETAPNAMSPCRCLLLAPWRRPFKTPSSDGLSNRECANETAFDCTRSGLEEVERPQDSVRLPNPFRVASSPRRVRAPLHSDLLWR